MSSATDYLESKIGDHMFRTGTWSKPSGIYVALFTAGAGDPGGGTEVAPNIGYTRVQHGPSDGTWNGPTNQNGIYTNQGSIQFGAPTDNWGTIVGFGLFDAATSGNLLIYQSLNATVVVNLGDPAPAFSTGSLSVMIS